MHTHDDDAALLYEHHVKEALFLDHCAAGFARVAHGLAAVGQEAGAAVERRRARVYRHKARKRLNAARRFLPH